MVDVKKTVGVYKGFPINVKINTEYKSVYAWTEIDNRRTLSAGEYDTFIIYWDGRLEARVQRVVDRVKRQIDELDATSKKYCQMLDGVEI